MIVVADASAVAAFILPDEAGLFADFACRTCTGNAIHVPAHWSAEIANVIWKAARRKRIVSDDVARLAEAAAVMGAQVTVGEALGIDELAAAAIQFELTAYDAAYVLLARTLAAPLLTRDERLRRVAVEQGIEVLAP